MRRPASGFSLAKRSRMRASTGMSLVGPEDAPFAAEGQFRVRNIVPLLRGSYHADFLVGKRETLARRTPGAVGSRIVVV